MELFSALIKERAETGRIYIMNVDHVIHTAHSKTQYTWVTCAKRLHCQQSHWITLMIEEGEIALCILSAINVGVIRSLDDLEELCELAVRALEEIIDYQKYPIKAAEISTKARRSV